MPSSGSRSSRFLVVRLCSGLGLILLGAAVLLPPTGIGGIRENPPTMNTLREATGEQVEVNPDGTFKTSLAWVQIGSDRYEKLVYFDQGHKRKAVYKTPAREFTENWDAAKGWAPGEVVRNETTLAARWGLPAAGWPYYVGDSALLSAGVAVLILALVVRPGRMRV